MEDVNLELILYHFPVILLAKATHVSTQSQGLGKYTLPLVVEIEKSSGKECESWE